MEQEQMEKQETNGKFKELFKAALYSSIIVFIEYAYFRNLKNIRSLEIKGSINNFDLIAEYPVLWKFLNIYIYISTFLIVTTIIFKTKKNSLKNNGNKHSKSMAKCNTNIEGMKSAREKCGFKKGRYNVSEKSKKHKFSLRKKENNRGSKGCNEVSLEDPRKEESVDELLKVLLGFNEEGDPIYLEEKGLFQNILITGSIGSGKTSSAMYTITRSFLEFSKDDNDKKIGMLILDVKGNYHEFVKNECKRLGRLDDLVIIGPKNNTYYNPLDKKELSHKMLASRLKYILLLFSPNNTESFWIDKAEEVISESIKFIRIYNDGYVNFNELNKIITDETYFFKIKKNLLNILKESLEKNDREYNQKIIYEMNTFISFYEKEFLKLDSRTKNIIKSEIGRMTNLFISDYDINKCFSPKEEEINFYGFKDLIDNGKIVVLNMNISEYGDVSKIIASYLKLDFQSEVLKQLGNGGAKRITAFISDEYQEYVTKNDADFYSQSREAKCISVISTQSFTSIKNKIKDESTSDVIIQNLVNKICFRTYDDYTISRLQKIIGKEEKDKTSITIGENSKEANYSFISNEFISDNSSISESISKYTQNDYRFDYRFFSQELETFEALGFLTDGNKISYVDKINMIPYFLF